MTNPDNPIELPKVQRTTLVDPENPSAPVNYLWPAFGAGAYGNRAYRATWTAYTYKVVFNQNDANSPGEAASGEMPEQDMTVGKWDPLIESRYTKTGYRFAGWVDNADDTSVMYNDGQRVRRAAIAVPADQFVYNGVFAKLPQAGRQYY